MSDADLGFLLSAIWWLAKVVWGIMIIVTLANIKFGIEKLVKLYKIESADDLSIT